MQHTRLLIMLLVGVAWVVTACSDVSSRRTMQRLQGGPSDERPPWLRDLPQPLERHPAPQGWGGDYLAALRIRADAG